jgi:hypothetical protein
MDINNSIDLCAINNTHYDISFVVFKILKDKYRYDKNNIWEYLDKNNNWVQDIKQKNLIYSIKTDVYKYFIKRAIEWSDNTILNNNYNINNNNMSNKLLFLSLKLKNNKYISSIIKESQQFFI